MAITGIIFDNQVPTAKGLRGAFKSALTDGIVGGCAITYSGANVNIGDGLINVAGGIFKITGTETISLSNITGSYARIKAIIDLSQTASSSAFEQVSFGVNYANSSTGFTALTQEDINSGTGTIYEAEICVVSISNGAISGLVRTATASSKIMYGDSLPADAPEGTIFLLKV